MPKHACQHQQRARPPSTTRVFNKIVFRAESTTRAFIYKTVERPSRHYRLHKEGGSLKKQTLLPETRPTNIQVDTIGPIRKEVAGRNRTYYWKEDGLPTKLTL